jgi:hypothetical protein
MTMLAPALAMVRPRAAMACINIRRATARAKASIRKIRWEQVKVALRLVVAQVLPLAALAALAVSNF